MKAVLFLVFILMEKTLEKLDAYKRLEIEITITQTRFELVELEKQIQK